MQRLTVFNHVSIDGCFVDAHGSMAWAHASEGDDADWRDFVAGNVRGNGTLVFGRVTYQMMAGFWPSPQALRDQPAVAARMNATSKIVFSRTLARADWNNTELLNPADIAAEMRTLKARSGDGLVILGSGTLVAQLAQAGLVDEFQLVVNPLALGGGRSLFEGANGPLPMQLLEARAFRNGKVLLRYAPVAR